MPASPNSTRNSAYYSTNSSLPRTQIYHFHSKTTFCLFSTRQRRVSRSACVRRPSENPERKRTPRSGRLTQATKMRRRKQSFRRGGCEATAKPPARARARRRGVGAVPTRAPVEAHQGYYDTRCFTPNHPMLFQKHPLISQNHPMVCLLPSG